MLQSKYRKWIIYLVVASLPFGLWLIYNELRSPGYCPPYPLLGFPTCHVVPFFFLLILASQFVSSEKFASLMFQVGAIAGLATAVWFSVNHALGNLQCPILFGIPLCYAALVDFLALITLNQIKCIDQNQCSPD